MDVILIDIEKTTASKSLFQIYALTTFISYFTQIQMQKYKKRGLGITVHATVIFNYGRENKDKIKVPPPAQGANQCLHINKL